MYPAPSPSAGRGEVVLQPNYFTSSVYVKALRDDLSTLILRYHEVYSQAGITKPFALFKLVWLNMGWNWLHFKVFDNRSRHTFLDVTLRLFLERTVKTEAPFTRVVALFAAYTFFYTQVKDPIPALRSVKNIPIPYDHYLSLTTMAEGLTAPQFLALQPHVRYIVSCFQKDNVFLILPKSDVGPMNPRELPREIYADDGIVFFDMTQKKKGRPSRREKGKKARLALEELDEMLSKPGSSSSVINEELAEYRAAKSAMSLPPGTMDEINLEVLGRLKDAQESLPMDVESEGVQRVEQAMAEDAHGVLGLLR